MSDTKKRLMQYFKNQGFRLNSVVKNISVSEKYFSNKSSVNSDVLEKVAEEYPDLNMDWVISGRGDQCFKNINKSNMSNKQIGKNLRSLREHLKFTPGQFAKYFDLTAKEILAIEQGDENLPKSFSEEIERIFNINLLGYNLSDTNIKLDENITRELLKQKVKLEVEGIIEYLQNINDEKAYQLKILTLENKNLEIKVSEKSIDKNSLAANDQPELKK